MGTQSENNRLLRLLQREEAVQLRGYGVACGPTGDIVIDHGRHVRGVWHFDGEAYAWTPAGYNEPTHRAADVDAAVRYTMGVLGARRPEGAGQL